MNARKLILRCYAEKEGDQWCAVCLDFTLAAQADTYEEAHEKLHQMICEYVYDALAGEDQDYADQLLTRRAPWYSWIRYYFYSAMRDSKDGLRRIFAMPMPLVPTNCHHA